VSSSGPTFRRTLPEGPWGATLLLALVLFAGGVALIERAWRRYGMVPSATSAGSMDLWDYERGRVHPLFRKSLFLVGGSRLLCDVDVGVLSKQLPHYEVAQLGVMGDPPLATLWDLAADERVHDAVIIVEVAEHSFERANWDKQEKWVRHSNESRNLAAGFEAHARALVESHLVVANPATGLQNLLEDKWPKRDYVTYGADRSCNSDYSLVDAPKARAARTARVRSFYAETKALDPASWLDQALAVEPYLHQLASRNVRVVFLRAPSTGDHWVLDSERYPRELYWNQFRDRLSVPTIHFKDYPGLAQFDAPDGSHMDGHDAALFTECLVDAVIDKGVVDGAMPSHCLVRRR
jgi:hypothetical protein